MHAPRYGMPSNTAEKMHAPRYSSMPRNTNNALELDKNLMKPYFTEGDLGTYNFNYEPLIPPSTIAEYVDSFVERTSSFKKVFKVF